VGFEEFMRKNEIRLAAFLSFALTTICLLSPAKSSGTEKPSCVRLISGIELSHPSQTSEPFLHAIADRLKKGGSGLYRFQITTEGLTWTLDPVESFKWYGKYVHPTIRNEVITLFKELDFESFANSLEEILMREIAELELPLNLHKIQAGQSFSGLMKGIVSVDLLFLDYSHESIREALMALFRESNSDPYLAVEILSRLSELELRFKRITQKYFDKNHNVKLLESIVGSLPADRKTPENLHELNILDRPDRQTFYFLDLPLYIEVKPGQALLPLPPNMNWVVGRFSIRSGKLKLKRTRIVPGIRNIL
jgi:hypothetical protein